MKQVIKEILSIEDLQEYIKSGQRKFEKFGNVRVVEKDNMLLFNYTAKAAFSGSMNFFEEISRGLIINATTGEIIARPFIKFYNWFENGRRSRGSIVEISEKMDGSLGILYKNPATHKWAIATRGSFDSKQALKATEMLHDQHDISDLPEDYTLLFEIIYPQNQIVVNYGKFEGLVLIGAINRFTGKELHWDTQLPSLTDIAYHYGFSEPKRYGFNNVTDILEACEQRGTNLEGWVVLFSDGARYKFKMDEYRDLHKILGNRDLNVLVAEWMLAGTADTNIKLLSASHKRESRKIKNHYKWLIHELETHLMNIYEKELMWLESRKDIAKVVMSEHKSVSNLLFAICDDKLTENMLLKAVLRGLD